MSEDPGEACQFCGRPVTADPVESDDGVFCAPGCRDVEATLDADAGPPDATMAASGNEGGDGETDRAFFRVTGMHCATCETFLEEQALSCEGVHDAAASYVTETVRVEYDPERMSRTEVRDVLSTAGYRVVDREATTGESVATAFARDSNPETRELEDLLGFRYVAGVVFGTFMLFPYIAVLYPIHFLDLTGGATGMFEGGPVESGTLLLLPLFAGVTGVVVFFTGLPLLRGAYVSLRTRQPNTDLLAALTLLAAYSYSIVALLLGRFDVYFDLAIVVAASVVAATFYESLVKQRAMERLTDLTVSQTDDARLCLPDGTTTVDVEDLDAGDRVLVRQGERIPVDGTLAEGTCTVDESIVTGESLPVAKEASDDLLGGSVVTEDAAVARVGDPPTSSIDRLTTAVWLLQSATHGLQRRTDRLAATLLLPLAAATVLGIAASLTLGRGPVGAVLAGLAAVLVACPWVLALSTPLSVATSLRAALERGIVVFDETVFERFRETDVVVFDKTGTLTSGEMRVRSADAPPEVLAAVGRLERRASHPAGDAIASAFADEDERTDSGREREADDRDETVGVSGFETHGLGVQGRVDGSEYLVGHPDLFARQGWTVSDGIRMQVRDAREDGRLPVVVGRDGTAEGVVVLGDEPREGWDEVLARLDERDLDVIVLTGDDERAAAFFREHPGVDHVFAGIPPGGKTETIRRLGADRRVTMVGDGTNDAPALARADLGIALGSGTALASDAADVAIADDDLGAVETTFDLARVAGKRARQNTALALGYNALVIPAAAVGLVNPLVTVAAAVVSGSLLAVNAWRPLLPESD
ncbi:hypothetical protein BRC65_06295 [Halobacteriales archaeon QH_2_65_14]|nr:MAG: hypothetical protein BRC65_06295 [Halobacteriales archaeon QH_2_65_14]